MMYSYIASAGAIAGGSNVTLVTTGSRAGRPGTRAAMVRPNIERGAG